MPRLHPPAWFKTSLLSNDFDDLESATEHHVAQVRGGHFFTVSTDYLFRDNAEREVHVQEIPQG